MTTGKELRRSSILLGESQTSAFNRVVGKSIDGLVILTVFFLGKAIWFPLGLGAALLLCSFQDGMGTGQSVGKRILGLRVIDDQTGLGCSFFQSFQRNFPFITAVIFAAVPLFWMFFILVSVPVIALETYLLFQLPSGVRLGDVLGNTLVAEPALEEIPMMQ
jgi:uncharacterized RDD family membrane protein YckC